MARISGAKTSTTRKNIKTRHSPRQSLKKALVAQHLALTSLMKFCTLSSGSGGNASFITDGKTSILVDCGINAKRVREALNFIGEDPDRLSGIIVTHEHSDHVAGVGVASRAFDAPVYANLQTMEAMRRQKVFGKLPPEKLIVFQNNESFRLGTLVIKAFHTSHDAADPVGFTVESGSSKVAILTDTGYITREAMENVPGAGAVLLEANHDEEMLKKGGYPYILKQRILSTRGHLCNELAADMAVSLIRSGTGNIILAHLSRENNLPEVALHTVLEKAGDAAAACGCKIIVAPEKLVSEVIEC